MCTLTNQIAAELYSTTYYQHCEHLQGFEIPSPVSQRRVLSIDKIN